MSDTHDRFMSVLASTGFFLVFVASWTAWRSGDRLGALIMVPAVARIVQWTPWHVANLASTFAPLDPARFRTTQTWESIVFVTAPMIFLVGLMARQRRRQREIQRARTNGVEALAAVQREAYDVVLMDVQMPEMDGLEASRRIVRRWPDRRPYIIAMTANAMQGAREACLAAGMDDYVTKPIRVEGRVEALRAVTVPGEIR